MTTIDKRVVQMNFDNNQFEKGTATSLESIARLKKGLMFEDTHKPMLNLADAFQSFGFAGQKAFGNLANGISAWEVIASVALGNIVSKAIDAGSALVKSLTIEPISLGFADYGRKLTSIQTITNSTGKSIEEVDKYFGMLDEYADKTVYNLDDMTGALAKFTNAGIELDISVPAIKGIANMVALAGQGQREAAAAFYNLSQSMQVGFLTTMDFRSLNLANVATAAWKDQMIAGAVAAGTLTKGTDGLYSMLGATKRVKEAQLFTEELSTGWATTDVMLKVFGDYGDVTTEIGKKAQAAAQDVKSWGMMMETLKASVGTGWTDTFEIMIGDLAQAKALFTPLTETIQGLLNIITDSRNNLLQEFSDLGGRVGIIDTVKYAFGDLKDIIQPVIDAFKEIFPPLTAKKLYEIVNVLKELTIKFKMGEESSSKLKRIFKGVFAVVDILRMAFVALANGLGKLVTMLSPTTASFVDLLASLGDWLVKLKDSIKDSEVLSNFFSGIAKIIGSLVIGVTGFFASLVKGFSSTEKLTKSDSMAKFLAELSEKFKGFGKVGLFFSKIFGIISKVAEKFGPVLKAIGSRIADLVDHILDAMTRGLDKLDAGKILDAFNSVFTGGMLLAVTGFINNAKKTVGTAGLGGILLAIMNFINSGATILTTTTGILDGVKDSLKEYQKSLKANMLMKIATAIALLVVSIIALTLVDQGKLVNATAAIAAMFVALTTTLDVFDKTTGGGKKMAILALTLIGVSLALAILAGVIVVLSLLSPADVAQGVLAIVGILTALLIFNTSSGGAVGLSGLALGLLSLSVGLLGLTFALRSLGGMDTAVLAQGIIGMGIALSIISTALTGMSAGLAGAGSLIIAAGAIFVLGMALKLIGSMSIEQVGIALLAVAGILTILGVAGYLLTPVIPIIALVAVSLLAMGAAALLFGLSIGAVAAGLGYLAIGIVTLAGLTSVGMASLTLVITGLATLMPIIAAQIAKGITAFLEEINKSLPKIKAALIGIGLEMLKGFSTMMPEVVKVVLEFIKTLLVSLNANIPDIVESGYELLRGILTGISNNIQEVTELGYDVAINFMKALTKKIPDLVMAAYDFIVAFVDGLAAAVEVNMPRLMVAFQNLSIAMLKGLIGGWIGMFTNVKGVIGDICGMIVQAFKDVWGIKSPSTVFAELGKNIVLGLVNGLKDFIYLAADAAVKVAQSVLTAVKKVFNTKSPSKETMTIGKYVVQGLANGISKFGDQAVMAAEVVAEKTLSGISGVISRISESINSDMDVNPTIRPVMDMSNITKGGLQIDKMFGDKRLSLDTSLNKVGNISTSLNAKDIPVTAVPSTTSPASVTFNQNNYSPKEISRIDIYRQTKNQLLQFKGLGGAL